MTILVFLGALLTCMIFGAPIALALIISGFAMMIQLGSFDAQIVASNMINGIDSFIFLAVPFFMLAGELMNAGGLSRRIVNMALALIGHLRGGMGYVIIFAAVVMASLSGSAIADSAALAALLVPMMRSAGYDVNQSAGLVAAGGIIAPIIPPSIGFIMFGVVGSVSITKLFLAGIFPGILMGLVLTVAWWWQSRKSTQIRLAPKKSKREMVVAVTEGFWALLMPVIIVGGLKTGIFTPTESAVVAVVYALLIGAFIYRELNLKTIYQCLVSSAKTTAVIMFVVSSAFVSAWMITIANLPGQLSEILSGFIDSPTLLMALMIGVTVLIGMALDFAPMVLILTPIMLPIAKIAGIDPVYFGVVFIMAVAVGLITPPVGNVLNVVASVSKLRFGDIVRGILPFLMAEIAVLLALVLFPALVLVPLGWLT